MKVLALLVFIAVLVAANAKPSLWLGGHGPVAPGAHIVGPAGVVSVGPSSAGAVVPGVGVPGLWGHGLWGHGLWGHHLW